MRLEEAKQIAVSLLPPQPQFVPQPRCLGLEEKNGKVDPGLGHVYVLLGWGMGTG